MLEAFATGCRGRMSGAYVKQLQEGGAAFYGVRPAWMHLWQQVIAEKRVWYWLDNSWFDVSREACFRIGCNAVQSWTHNPSSGVRLGKLGVQVMPWRKTGGKIIVCSQSDEFLRTVSGWPDGADGWQRDVFRSLHPHTDREIVLRHKRTVRPLAADLQDAWLLVTHSSAAAVEALIRGIPVIVTDPRSAAAGFSTEFAAVETPYFGEGREQWAAQLADSQWTLDEMKSGRTWRMLNEHQ